LMPTWFVPVWSAIRPCGLPADTMRSRSQEERTC
jgi:hypothetical protein